MRGFNLDLPGLAGWTVLDQCLFGASNLVLNILLARWLPNEQYGVFAAVLSVLFLVGILHAALFVEPMLVLGAKHRDEQDAYLRLLLAGHALFGIATIGVCAALATFFLWNGHRGLAGILAAFALAAPCVLASWLTRRIFYLRGAPRMAAFASGLYFVLLLVGVVIANRLDVLSAGVSLLVMALASALVSALLLAALPMRLFERIEPTRARRMLQEHWSLSRWLVLVVPFEWIPGNYYYLALPMIAGLGAPALLKASLNLVQPLMQVFAALRIMLTPIFVASIDSSLRTRRAVRPTAAMVGAATLWYALLFFWGDALVALLYGPAYSEIGPLLRILGLVPVFFALGAVGSALLRARERTGQELAVGIMASGVSLLVGVPLMIEHGALGACYALVAAYAAFAVGRFVLLGWGGRPHPEALDASAQVPHGASDTPG